MQTNSDATQSTGSGELMSDAMVDALEAELADDMDEFNGRQDFAAAWFGR